MSRQVHHPFVLPVHVCMIVISISKPFDDMHKVEVKFALSPCHGVKGGELYLLLAPDEAKQFHVGQEFNNVIQRIN